MGLTGGWSQPTPQLQNSGASSARPVLTGTASLMPFLLITAQPRQQGSVEILQDYGIMAQPPSNMILTQTHLEASLQLLSNHIK